MTRVERELEQQPDFVDPLSCPHARRAFTDKVRKLSVTGGVVELVTHKSTETAEVNLNQAPVFCVISSGKANRMTLREEQM